MAQVKGPFCLAVNVMMMMVVENSSLRTWDCRGRERDGGDCG
jgi:hypothetical protein